MSRRTLEEAVQAIHEHVKSAQALTLLLKDEIGVDPAFARMIAPTGEAELFVNAMDKLFTLLDNGIIINAGDMLKEIEEVSYLTTRDIGVEVRMRVLATRLVADDLFYITEDQMNVAIKAGQTRALVRKQYDR